jgi:hypothetical protein
MKTVPTPKLSPPQIASWNVRRSRFPFGVGEVIGAVEAHHKTAAQAIAEAQFGKHVVVERAFRNVDTGVTP